MRGLDDGEFHGAVALRIVLGLALFDPHGTFDLKHFGEHLPQEQEDDTDMCQHDANPLFGPLEEDQMRNNEIDQQCPADQNASGKHGKRQV